MWHGNFNLLQAKPLNGPGTQPSLPDKTVANDCLWTTAPVKRASMRPLCQGSSSSSQLVKKPEKQQLLFGGRPKSHLGGASAIFNHGCSCRICAHNRRTSRYAWACCVSTHNSSVFLQLGQFENRLPLTAVVACRAARHPHTRTGRLQVLSTWKALNPDSKGERWAQTQPFVRGPQHVLEPEPATQRACYKEGGSTLRHQK